MIDDKPYCDLFRLLSNQDRMLMLSMMIKKERVTPTEIGKAIFLEQPSITHHLNLMKKHGLILKSEKVGRNIYYSVNRDKIKLLLDVFWGEIGD